MLQPERYRPPLQVLLALACAILALKPAPVPRSLGPGAAYAQAAGQPMEIIVSAAASLAAVLEEARLEFAPLHPDIDVRLNFGSSGSLQRQIERGAPVDLFIAAAAEPVAALVAGGWVDPAGVRTVAANRLVLVAPRPPEAGGHREPRVEGWDGLASTGTGAIAIGNPSHVPAGSYARAALESLGLWDALLPRLIFAENVRQALYYVETGEVAAGIVYLTDALASGRVEVVAHAPPGSHPPITYPVAAISRGGPGRPEAEAARRFADFLLSEAGQRLLQRHGFLPPPADPAPPAGSRERRP